MGSKMEFPMILYCYKDYASSRPESWREILRLDKVHCNCACGCDFLAEGPGGNCQTKWHLKVSSASAWKKKILGVRTSALTNTPSKNWHPAVEGSWICCTFGGGCSWTAEVVKDNWQTGLVPIKCPGCDETTRRRRRLSGVEERLNAGEDRRRLTTTEK